MINLSTRMAPRVRAALKRTKHKTQQKNVSIKNYFTNSGMITVAIFNLNRRAQKVQKRKVRSKKGNKNQISPNIPGQHIQAPQQSYIRNYFV